jgi:hypothetical protein
MDSFVKTKLVVFTLVIGLLTAVLTVGCGQVRVTGSGNVVNKTYTYSDFTKLYIAYGFTAEVKASTTYKIEVKADDNLFDYISVTKQGELLTVRMKPGSYSQSHLQVTISMPVLKDIKLTDGGKTEVSGFSSSNDLNVWLADGTKLTGSITAQNVKITLTDGSYIELNGSGNNFNLVNRNGSRADLQNFTVVNADVSISDGGNLNIRATGTLNADLTAGSRVIYFGNPTLGNIKLAAGSTVTKGN